MPKHLHFNPRVFDELVLSGVLIEFFKNDIEVHQHHGEDQTLKFVQGENIVEHNVESILRFANTISGHKIFGRNWQQQAVINMISGVCKDIEKKLSNSVQSSEFTDKIQYLNTFWFTKQNQWLKKRFFSCHMQLLSLSFAIQEKFPQILTKYQCFIQLRKLFIEEKLLSKPSLIAMFTNSENKYQQFDLFPELESSTHSVRRSMGSTYIEDAGDDVEVNLESYVEVIGQEMESHEVKEQPTFENIHEQKSEMHTLKTEENQSTVNVQHQNHQTQHNDNHPSIQHPSDVSTLNQTDPASYIPSPEKQKSKVDPQHVVISHVKQHQSAIIENIPSEIEVQQKEHVTSDVEVEVEVKVQVQEHQTDKHENHQDHHHQKSEEKIQKEQLSNSKKSLKQSFSEHLSRPLQYSTKNLADQEIAMTKNQQVNNQHQKVHIQEPVSQAVPSRQNSEQKEQQKQGLIRANATFELKKQALIEEAESENYVSQENLHIEKEKPVNAQQENHQQNQKSEPKKVASFQHQANKAPQSQSHNASVKGPQSAMKDAKIKPKEQTVVVHKQTCKCEIF